MNFSTPQDNAWLPRWTPSSLSGQNYFHLKSTNEKDMYIPESINVSPVDNVEQAVSCLIKLD